MTKREWSRQKEIEMRLQSLLGLSFGERLLIEASMKGTKPASFNLTWREQDALDAVTLREYRGPRRPFDGSYSGR